jgi:hypothetical protein
MSVGVSTVMRISREICRRLNRPFANVPHPWQCWTAWQTTRQGLWRRRPRLSSQARDPFQAADPIRLRRSERGGTPRNLGHDDRLPVMPRLHRRPISDQVFHFWKISGGAPARSIRLPNSGLAFWLASKPAKRRLVRSPRGRVRDFKVEHVPARIIIRTACEHPLAVYSITSSARASSIGGISRPSPLAVI